MSPSIRLALRLFGVFPVQRWVALFGIALVVVDVFAQLAGLSAAGMFHAVGFASILLSSIATVGPVFRGQAAMRAQALAPSARPRLLAGLVLHIAMLLAAFCLSLVVWPGAVDLAPSIETALVYPLFYLTWIYLGIITAARSIGTLWLVALSSLVAGYWIANAGTSALAAAGFEPATLAAVATLAAWAVFVSWFLSARTITISSWMHASQAFGDKKLPDAWVPRSPQAAVTALISGQFPAPFHEYLKPIIIASLVLVILRNVFGSALSPDGLMQFLHSIGMVMLSLAIGANQIARRTRYVWLRHGPRRTDLFKTAERKCLRLYAYFLSFMALVFLSLQTFTPGLPVSGTAALFAQAMANGLFALYFGLMCVRGFRAGDVAIGVVLVLAHLFGRVTINEGIATIMPVAILTSAQIAAAAACRAAGMRRWRRIDWLRLKPSAWLDGALGGRR